MICVCNKKTFIVTANCLYPRKCPFVHTSATCYFSVSLIYQIKLDQIQESSNKCDSIYDKLFKKVFTESYNIDAITQKSQMENISSHYPFCSEENNDPPVILSINNIGCPYDIESPNDNQPSPSYHVRLYSTVLHYIAFLPWVFHGIGLFLRGRTLTKKHTDRSDACDFVNSDLDNYGKIGNDFVTKKINFVDEHLRKRNFSLIEECESVSQLLGKENKFVKMEFDGKDKIPVSTGTYNKVDTDSILDDLHPCEIESQLSHNDMDNREMENVESDNMDFIELDFYDEKKRGTIVPDCIKENIMIMERHRQAVEHHLRLNEIPESVPKPPRRRTKSFSMGTNLKEEMNNTSLHSATSIESMNFHQEAPIRPKRVKRRHSVCETNRSEPFFRISSPEVSGLSYPGFLYSPVVRASVRLIETLEAEAPSPITPKYKGGSLPTLHENPNYKGLKKSSSLSRSFKSLFSPTKESDNPPCMPNLWKKMKKKKYKLNDSPPPTINESFDSSNILFEIDDSDLVDDADNPHSKTLDGIFNVEKDEALSNMLQLPQLRERRRSWFEEEGDEDGKVHFGSAMVIEDQNAEIEVLDNILDHLGKHYPVSPHTHPKHPVDTSHKALHISPSELECCALYADTNNTRMIGFLKFIEAAINELAVIDRTVRNVKVLDLSEEFISGYTKTIQNTIDELYYALDKIISSDLHFPEFHYSQDKIEKILEDLHANCPENIDVNPKTLASTYLDRVDKIIFKLNEIKVQLSLINLQDTSDTQSVDEFTCDCSCNKIDKSPPNCMVFKYLASTERALLEIQSSKLTPCIYSEILQERNDEHLPSSLCSVNYLMNIRRAYKLIQKNNSSITDYVAQNFDDLVSHYSQSVYVQVTNLQHEIPYPSESLVNEYKYKTSKAFKYIDAFRNGDSLPPLPEDLEKHRLFSMSFDLNVGNLITCMFSPWTYEENWLPVKNGIHFEEGISENGNFFNPDIVTYNENYDDEFDSRDIILDDKIYKNYQENIDIALYDIKNENINQHFPKNNSDNVLDNEVYKKYLANISIALDDISQEMVNKHQHSPENNPNIVIDDKVYESYLANLDIVIDDISHDNEIINEYFDENDPNIPILDELVPDIVVSAFDSRSRSNSFRNEPIIPTEEEFPDYYACINEINNHHEGNSHNNYEVENNKDKNNDNIVCKDVVENGGDDISDAVRIAREEYLVSHREEEDFYYSSDEEEPDIDRDAESFSRGDLSDTPSPGPPVDHEKDEPRQESPRSHKDEERIQKDRSIDIYPETVRQRQRTMAPSPNKVDIKNWTSSTPNDTLTKNKKFLPSVKALRNQFETGKPSTTNTPSRHGSLTSSNNSLNSSSLEKSNSCTSLTSHGSSDNILDIDEGRGSSIIPDYERDFLDDEPVEPIFSQFRQVDEELRELMSKPPSTSGWNPRLLLKRLYYIPEVPKTASQAANYLNIEGYLEKLPSGRKKATFWNAWKRRYFVAKDGVLFYYQNNQSEKPSMKLTLMGGKVETMEANMVGVDDGKGHFVVVRCSSRQEAERWKKSLETHTVEDFASQYVQPWPMSTNPSLLRDTLVIDIGSSSVRAGILASQATLPQIFYPTVQATDRESRRQIWGFEALSPNVRSSSTLTFPIRPSHKISKYSLDLSAVSSLLQKTFADLNVDPKNYNLQLSVPRVLNNNTQTELLRILFEKYGVKSVNLTHQSILALYAYNATSGIVVDIGERMDIVPVIDGYIVDGGVSRVPYGGFRILDHLRQFLYMRNVSLINHVDSYIIRQVLESVCYCAQHYNTEKAKCSHNSVNFEKSVPLNEFFQEKCPFEGVSLDFGRFQSTEGLFNPDAWGLDHPGLHKLVHKAIQECSMDIRKEMSRSIFLAGGVTQLPGLVERLTTELDNLTPAAIRPKVHSSPYRYHAAYLGACVLAESPAFVQSRITKEEWMKQGSSSLRKWAL